MGRLRLLRRSRAVNSAFDRIHPGEAKRKEHGGDSHPDDDALEKAEGEDGGQDQQKNPVIGPGQPLEGPHEPFVQHVDADVKQQPSHERYRDQFQYRVAQKQRRAHHEGNDNAGQPSVGPHRAADR